LHPGYWSVSLTESSPNGPLYGFGGSLFVSPTTPKPRVIVLNEPATDVTIPRGSYLKLGWYTTGGSASDTIYFYLSSTSSQYTANSYQYVPAYKGSFSFPVSVPPGKYVLAGTYSYITGYSTSSYSYGDFYPYTNSATISKKINVTVVGQAQT